MPERPIWERAYNRKGFLAVGAATAFLAACGSDDDGDDGGQAAETTETGEELLVRQQRTGNGDAESLGQGDRVVVTWAPDAALELEGREEDEA